MSLKHGANAGFTLIELMLVVIIIGILAAMVVPNLVGKAESARVTRAKADVEAGIAMPLDLFEQDTGAYPTTAEGLQALIKQPDGVTTNWKGPYLKKSSIPLDPWGRPYQYVCPGTHNKTFYDLFSFGKDGKEGGGDDVTNFDDEDTQ